MSKKIHNFALRVLNYDVETNILLYENKNIPSIEILGPSVLGYQLFFQYKRYITEILSIVKIYKQNIFKQNHT